MVPDLMVICKRVYKTYVDFVPPLIVEVLLRTSEERDRGIKLDYYKKLGVKYYLIVDGKKQATEVYELVDGNYQLKESETSPALMIDNNITLRPDLHSIWI